MLRAAGIAISLVPFGFGAVRAIQTGMTDLRYLPMAVASHVAAVITLVVARAGAQPRERIIGLAIVAFLLATAAAFGVGWLVGARNILSMLIVAGGFAGCSAVGTALPLFEKR